MMGVAPYISLMTVVVDDLDDDVVVIVVDCYFPIFSVPFNFVFTVLY